MKRARVAEDAGPFSFEPVRRRAYRNIALMPPHDSACTGEVQVPQ